MSEVSITLPIPPSANRYWMVANNRIIVTDEARAYKSRVFFDFKYLEPFRKDVALNISVYRPSRRGDLDNYLKVMLDSLKGIIYLDDSQVVEIHTFRYDDKYNPRVEFLAYEVE